MNMITVEARGLSYGDNNLNGNTVDETPTMKMPLK